jgi:LPS-assembly protein
MKGSNELQVTSYKLLSKPIFYILHSALNLLLVTRYSLLVTALLFTVHCSLATAAWAATITADHLEYFQDEDRYVATGNVRIEREDAVLTADRVIFYHKTSDAKAEGNVVYMDAETVINAERAELNLDAKTGKLHNAIIFLKKDNYWITGDSIEKIKENHYYAKTATFTTCDVEPSYNPDWCFKGSNVDIIVGRRLTARDVTFRIKGLPVLYSPYLWAPVKTERETGFLIPHIGHSSRKGFQFSPAFFWAIDEDKDATFYLDYYSKLGIGKGVEFRYITFSGRGNWYAYHIRDRELKKNFYEVKGFNEHYFKNIRGLLDINYVNYEDFYRRYGRTIDDRIQRFLQSTGEVSMSFDNSRLYLLGQHWIDLKKPETVHVPQRLPEVGYVINPVSIGPMIFTMSSSLANFYRDKGPAGQRLDLHSTLSYSFGDWVQVFQSISPRVTFYNLTNEENYGKSFHRETFEYRAVATSRIVRQYGSFSHIIEPSIEYRFIPDTRPVPLFDATELFGRTSAAHLSLHNIISFRRFALSARITQPYDFNAEDNALQPTVLQASISGPFTLNFDMSYDFNVQEVKTVNSDLSVKAIEGTTVTIGKRYAKDAKIMQSRVGIDSAVTRNISVHANIWYDLRGGGVRESALRTRYSQQCWAMDLSLSRTPGDNIMPAEYSFMVLFELRGLGIFRAL